eukprot:2385556-Pleurochrysis_carterae.AAC.1
MADTGSAQADNNLRIFRDCFKLNLQVDKPKQFLGMNIDMRDDGGVKISAAAHVRAKAETYLFKPLEEYPLYNTPSTPQLVKDYEIAARKEHYVDPTFQKNYQSMKAGCTHLRPPLWSTRRVVRDRHTCPSANFPDESHGRSRQP